MFNWFKNDRQFKEDIRKEFASLSNTFHTLNSLTESLFEKLDSVKKDNDRLFQDFTEELDDFRKDQEDQFEELKKSLSNHSPSKPSSERDGSLLPLIRIYRKELRALERMLETDDAWNEQVKLLEEKLRKEEASAGIFAFGKEGDLLNLDMHEIAQVTACEDPAIDRTVAGVFEEGFMINGRIAQKAIVSAYKYGGSQYGA